MAYVLQVDGGKDPQKAADEDYRYVFVNYTPAYAKVTDDQVYTAVYDQIARTYGEPVWAWDGNDEVGYSASAATFTTNDGETTFTKTVDASVTTSVEQALCEKDGKTIYLATVRFKGTDYTDRKEVKIPALGHDWDEGKITTAPTCTKKGVKTFKSNRCGETRTEEVAALGLRRDVEQRHGVGKLIRHDAVVGVVVVGITYGNNGHERHG